VVGLGYGVAWRTLDARHFGVAQRRRRVFIVAALNEAFGGLGADRAAEVLFECAGGCGHLEASGTKGEGSPGGSGGGVEVARALRASLGKRGERGDGGDELVIGTIGAGLAKRTGTTQDPHLVGWGDRTFGADISNTIPARYHKGINTTVEPGHLVGAEAHADGVREVDGVARRVDDSQRVEDPRRLGNFELWDFPKEAVAPTISAKHDQRVMVYGGEVKAYSVREDAKANNFSATEIEVANALSAVWAGEQSHHAQTFIASAPVEEGLLSFPSRFGSNADVTEDITQSFAHSAGAPAVMRVGSSYDGLNQKMESDGAHRTIRVGRDSSDFVVAEAGVEDDPLLPLGLDSHRYRVAGNGVVAPVAEFIGRRLVGVDAKWFKKEVEG
jgi:site-specific DNA-cytosine methylase